MKRALAILLMLACLMAGCTQNYDAYVPTGDGLTNDDAGPSSPSGGDDQALTLTYYPDITLNPYLCTDFTNRVLFGLLFQRLFVVSRDYRVEPMLCKSYQVSKDKKTYTFYIEDTATFSDGTLLTAEDVVASLNAAKASNYYSGRFLQIKSVALSGDGGVKISLKTPCENLPILLDIPIVKASEVNENRPLGTGPYYLDNSSVNPCLRRRTDWWCSAQMVVTASTIALVKAESTTQIRDNFQFSDLGLVCADPGSDRYADYRCDYELWDIENGIFLYLACNEKSSTFSDPEVRAALTYAIDRDYLVSAYYRGFARSATLPASPQAPYYSTTLAKKYAYDGTTFQQVISDKGLKGKTITFLVNSDDSLRVRVAREIKKALESAGLVVKMKEVSTTLYKETLLYKTYDIYLGQTALSANMDLSAFLYSSGKLSYGSIDDAATYAVGLRALENEGNYYTLHQMVMEQGILCPILFRSYAVFATRGLLSNLTPARDNVFYYSLGRSMEEALIPNET